MTDSIATDLLDLADSHGVHFEPGRAFPERTLLREASARITALEAESAERLDAYHAWKEAGTRADEALLEIWRDVNPDANRNITYGDDPRSVVDSVQKHNFALEIERNEFAAILSEASHADDCQLNDISQILTSTANVTTCNCWKSQLLSKVLTRVKYEAAANVLEVFVDDLKANGDSSTFNATDLETVVEALRAKSKI